MEDGPSKRSRTLKLVCLCSLFGLLGFILPAYFWPKEPAEAPEGAAGPEERDTVLFLEAVTCIRDNALFLSPAVSRKTIIEDALKAYLTRNDIFSDYLTPDEYHRFKDLQADKYVGIGMEIEKDREGRVVCFPYPGGPAEKAGLRAGDLLESINGTIIKDKSLLTIAAMVRGKSGTTVQLTVTTAGGIEKHMLVTCSEVQSELISKRLLGSWLIIELHRFTLNTKEKLEYFLRTGDGSKAVIIDLRGNPGGDLNAAIDSAALFLKEGQKIVTIAGRKGSRVYRGSPKAFDLAFPVYLWQDGATASAAEVFIAALTDNNRAVSIGQRTFGKGTEQDVIELSDGSALILTTGRLLTPNGVDYQGVGLDPGYSLKGGNAETGDYLKKVKELMNSR